ncbi:MAG: M43 family zinc metalloprotease [Cytophagaceae bacterium]|jgi:hypothetical protein|nr:M43 family zinc metalloprotease [Cytophagaceae bacterium]
MKKFLLATIFFTFGSYMSFAQVPTVATPLPQLNKEFQVIAHIVYDKDSNEATSPLMVTAVLNNVNSFFAPIGVSFRVCEIRSIYNFQYYDTIVDARVQEMVNQNFANNRINIYYLNSYKAPVGGKCYNTVAGTGFIVIVDNSPTTVAHELGHYFSLDHTFGTQAGTTAELVNASNCSTTGDRICDTPADPYTQSQGEGTFVDVNANCNFIYAGRDANGHYYNPDVGNIMSYYVSCNDCPHFTHGQLLKMANYYISTFNTSSKDRW